MKNLIWASCFLSLFAGCRFEDRLPVEMVTTSQKQPFNNEKNLDSTVRFDIGSLEITGEKQAGLLYSYDLEYDKASYTPDTHYNINPDGKAGQFFVSLQGSHRSGIHPQRHNNRLRIALTELIPLKLDINAGVGEARLSLSGLKISRVNFESGVGEAKISIYEPNAVPCEDIKIKNGVGRLEAIGLGNLNFRELEFEGGIGGASLDFSGEWKQHANIRIQVGVGGVNVRVPRELGVKVEAEKHFLSGLHLEGFRQEDSYYYSENYDTAAIRVSVHVKTGIGGLRITRL